MPKATMMFKRISNTTISKTVPEHLIMSFVAQGWLFSKEAAERYLPSAPLTPVDDLAHPHECSCGIFPGMICRCSEPSEDPTSCHAEASYRTQPPTQDFYALLDKMRDIHDRKAADYAPGEDRFKNFRECEAMGITAFEGAVVRMSDKMSRVKNLIAKQRRGEGAAVVDESIEDTLFDLAVYALIAIQLHGEGK